MWRKFSLLNHLLLLMLAISLILFLTHAASGMESIITYSNLQSNLTQRIVTGCSWDGISANVIVIGYYKVSDGHHKLNELTPAVIPGQDFFLLVFTSGDFSHSDLTLSHVVVFYGEKAC